MLDRQEKEHPFFLLFRAKSGAKYNPPGSASPRGANEATEFTVNRKLHNPVVNLLRAIT